MGEQVAARIIKKLIYAKAAAEAAPAVYVIEYRRHGMCATHYSGQSVKYNYKLLRFEKTSPSNLHASHVSVESSNAKCSWRWVLPVVRGLKEI